jgi:hypothetical protein
MPLYKYVGVCLVSCMLSFYYPTEPYHALACAVVTKTLSAGESMLVDGDAILCFESSVTIEVEFVGNFMAVCCSGEGLFNTKMTGTLLTNYACISSQHRY